MSAPYLIGDERAMADFLTNANVAPVTAAGLVGLQSSTIAASAAIAATETLIGNIPLIAGSTLKAGSLIRITAEGTCTSSNADSAVFTLRAGILGTKADASVTTWTVTTAGSGSSVPFRASIDFVVRVPGAAGTGAGSLVLTNNGTTGIAAAAVTVVAATTSTLATTTATFLDVTYTSASTSATTFQDVTIEVLS